MRLTLKISFAILLSIILLFSVHSFLSVQREREQLKLNLSREAHNLGQSLRLMLMEIERTSGTDAAIRFLDTAGLVSADLRLRWVWLDGRVPRKYLPQVAKDKLAPLHKGESVSLLVESEQGRDSLVTYLPLKGRSGRLGAIELSKSLDQLHGYVHETVRRSYLLVLATIVSGLFLMAVLGSLWINRPVRKLSEEAERIGSGDLSQSIEISGRDELAGLASTINRMRDQLATAREREQQSHKAEVEAIEKLRHTERLATVGRLSAGMAHEIGTPLNVISGRAKMIARQELKPEDAARSASIIGEQAERIAILVRQLLNFARRGETSYRRFDLRDLLLGSVELVLPAAHKKMVAVDCLPGEVAVVVEADSGQLQQVLLNLLTNAIQASSEGGRVCLSLSHEDLPSQGSEDSTDGPLCSILVEDQGSGIAAPDLEHIFDPFFTTKEIGQGTGLGLSIVHGIVTEHGGRIEVSSTPGEGSRFKVFLPRRDDGAAT